MARTAADRADQGGGRPAAAARALSRRRADPVLLVAVAAGGVLGTWGRLGLAELLPAEPGRWPWATFAANVAGCLLLGYAATRLLERLPPSTYRRPLVGTGLCGGLTTFSTLQLEAIEIGRNGHVGLAAAYVATSVALGFGAIVLTAGLVRRARLAPA